MKYIITMFALVISFTSVFAQDIIVKNDGSKITGNVIHSDKQSISYTLDGSLAIHRIKTSNVHEVGYKVDGMSDYSKGSKAIHYITVKQGSSPSYVKKSISNKRSNSNDTTSEVAPYLINGCFYASILAGIFFWY